MSKLFELIKQNGPFMVLTNDKEFPQGRPFGAIMEKNNKLYISTSNKKNVYKQMINDNHISLLSINGREWLRVEALAKECNDLAIKQDMLDSNPRLYNIYKEVNCSYYAVFELDVVKALKINDLETIDLLK